MKKIIRQYFIWKRIQRYTKVINALAVAGNLTKSKVAIDEMEQCIADLSSLLDGVE